MMERDLHSSLLAHQPENVIHKADPLPEFCNTSAHREQSAHILPIKVFVFILCVPIAFQSWKST